MVAGALVSLVCAVVVVVFFSLHFLLCLLSPCRVLIELVENDAVVWSWASCDDTSIDNLECVKGFLCCAHPDLSHFFQCGETFFSEEGSKYDVVAVEVHRSSVCTTADDVELASDGVLRPCEYPCAGMLQY